MDLMVSMYHTHHTALDNVGLVPAQFPPKHKQNLKKRIILTIKKKCIFDTYILFENYKQGPNLTFREDLIFINHFQEMFLF